MNRFKFRRRVNCRGCGQEFWEIMTVDLITGSDYTDRSCDCMPRTAVDIPLDSRWEQSLGISDKEGNFLYEGDRVEGYGGTAVIKYNDHYEAGGRFYPDFGNDDNAEELWNEKPRWRWFEAIGNIHEQ